MNNEERIQKRIERDKARRAAKKAQRVKEADDYNKVLTMQHYHNSLRKCRKGVMWKGKPQAYCNEGITNVLETLEIVESEKLPPLKNTTPIILYERGKERKIIPITSVIIIFLIFKIFFKNFIINLI